MDNWITIHHSCRGVVAFPRAKGWVHPGKVSSLSQGWLRQTDNNSYINAYRKCLNRFLFFLSRLETICKIHVGHGSNNEEFGLGVGLRRWILGTQYWILKVIQFATYIHTLKQWHWLMRYSMWSWTEVWIMHIAVSKPHHWWQLLLRECQERSFCYGVSNMLLFDIGKWKHVGKEGVYLVARGVLVQVVVLVWSCCLSHVPVLK